MNLAEALKRIKDNPDDLTELPQIIEQVASQEQEIDSYQKRIVEMRELNKKYLAMVPIPGNEPDEPKDEEQEPATLEDAKDYFENYFNKGDE